MSRAGKYLGIPADYVECLDGLRWSESGDAVETAVGATFAINHEIAAFLEGFASRGPLIHFGHILHLLHMLKRGGTFAALRHAYEAARHPARNAGAFCALLCDTVPPLADPPQVLEVWHALMTSHYVASLSGPLPEAVPGRAAEMPSLDPLTFEERILRALAAYRDDELHHWFHRGQGPVKQAGSEIARAVVELRPRSLHGVLASLAQRERLAGAVPFVAQLVSALTLPPRRLSHPELPIGGYADVTTRGQPEQVLPSQLAIDELEFVRRFAENELLYFRREEPHARLREELVILLDQGVRTWGIVRLVLGAAFFAFGKLAHRRKLLFQVATTGTEGQLSDLLQENDAVLGEILDASDMSPNPGLALEAVLEQQTTADRDVVLLSHPRSLHEADVSAAARRVAPGTRLFAVTVDERGSVELAEMRHGTPVSLGRIRVDLTKSVPEPKSRKPVEPMPRIPSATPWRGDVEPIGYPFLFGLPDPMLDGRFDFDGSGNWLLVACRRSMLLATRTDGSASEMLPRGVADGQAMQNPDAVLGVAGGFVVAGKTENQLVVFHYDLAERTCRAHKLGASAPHRWVWCYVPQAHSVVARAVSAVSGVDLGTSERFWNDEKPFRAASRVQNACLIARGGHMPAPRVNIVHVPDVPPGGVPLPGVCLNPVTGELTVHKSGWQKFTPQADGLPVLRGGRILQAVYQENTLALSCRTSKRNPGSRLFIYRGPEGKLLLEASHPSNDVAFTLSPDGSLLAEQQNPFLLKIRNVVDGTAAVQPPPRGRFHNNIAVILGKQALLVGVGKYGNLIQWGGDRLEHLSISGPTNWPFPASRPKQPAARFGSDLFAPVVITPELQRMIDTIRPDLRRFVTVHEGPLIVLVDRYGQIALLDRLWNLVCMVFVFRGQMAAWMPDGTRYGPAVLTGGPETPDAAKRIARRLQHAWMLAEDSRRSASTAK